MKIELSISSKFKYKFGHFCISKYIIYLVIRINNRISDTFEYAQNVQKDFKQATDGTDEVKEFSKHIITGIERTSAEINGAATGVDSVTELVASFGDKLDKLNLRMSKRSIIICDIIDFLQQIENLLTDSLKKKWKNDKLDELRY